MHPQSASVLLNRLLARARFRHVQVLVRLAELGSVRRTADSVGMTQPAVTQILADLEAMVDTPLFHRHARGVRPTPAGADLLPLARQLLLGMAATAEAITTRKDQGGGIVRVVASVAAINGQLAGALPAFSQQHPAVQVHLKEAEGEGLLLAVARGEADIACCRRLAQVPEGWRFQSLAPDRFVVVGGPDHPLARKRQVSMADLAHERWLPAPAGTAAREAFDALIQRFPAPPAVCNVITRVPLVTMTLLRSGRLITLLPASIVRQFVAIDELRVLNLRDPMPLDALGMLLPENEVNAATARFAEFLAAHAKG